VSQSTIIGFHPDDEGQWIAELSCGHTQHMRHDPPWQNRPWVLTKDGRQRYIGVAIPCALCDRPEATASRSGSR
jgi:Protein of unknown function (DUF3565)